MLKLSVVPGREPPDVVYGYSFGDTDESGFFGSITGDELTLEGSNVMMSLVVGRDTSFARSEWPEEALLDADFAYEKIWLELQALGWNNPGASASRRRRLGSRRRSAPARDRRLP